MTCFVKVVAAATFGNFINPNSIKDFPLICYRHNGFGILKQFLLTCSGIISIDTQKSIKTG